MITNNKETIKHYLKEHKCYSFVNEDAVPSQYKQQTESDIDDFEKVLEGKAILKVNTDKSHTFDGLAAIFRGVLVVNNLEYSFLFSTNENNPLISMNNSQNIIQLTPELITVFTISLTYFNNTWKPKWVTTLNSK